MSGITVGIQLYTVRDDCKTDFKGTVAALAEMGYQGVEFAGNYGGMNADELAAFLAGLGLKCCGQHVSLQHIAEPASAGYAYAKALGCPYLTTSLCGEVADRWPATIVKVAQAGAAAKANGCLFTYHNHSQEFDKVDGECALDRLYRKTPAAEVQAQIDTFWVKKGGEDPVAYIRKYPGRVPHIHLKDMDPADGSMTEVGNGLMNLPGIFGAGRFVGSKWMIVEQDTCQHPPLESARISVENLKKAGLA